MTSPTTAKLNAAYDQLNFWYDKAKKLDEELAKAEERIAELESRTVTAPDSLKCSINSERLAELAAGQSGLNLRVATPEESMELARLALDRSTVTVKLPDIELPIDGTGYASAAGERRYKKRVIDVLSAAGIQVIEGEGQ